MKLQVQEVWGVSDGPEEAAGDSVLLHAHGHDFEGGLFPHLWNWGGGTKKCPVKATPHPRHVTDVIKWTITLLSPSRPGSHGVTPRQSPLAVPGPQCRDVPGRWHLPPCGASTGNRKSWSWRAPPHLLCPTFPTCRSASRCPAPQLTQRPARVSLNTVFHFTYVF